MPAELNHTIVWCKDNRVSSALLADMLGLPAPVRFANFMVVSLANGVSMDFMAHPGGFGSQHYAFLVGDAEFDAGMAKIRDQGLAYWADPHRSRPGEINTHFGGRGVYFEDLDGHLLELITKPYGSEEGL